MEKLVSVVIPVYNVEEYLQNCIESVFSQTYHNLEIILVDDGSSDKSGKLCDEYAEADSRVRVIHKKNGGASSARNVGIQIANGEYIYFLDSDDYIDDSAIEKLVCIAERNGADLVFMDGIVFDDGVISGKNKDHYKHSSHYESSSGRNIIREQLDNDDFFVLVQLLLIKQELLQSQQLSFYEGIVCEDELFVFYVFYYARIAAQLPEQLLHRRMRADSVMTSMNTEKRLFSILTVFNDMMMHFKRKRDDVLIIRFRMLANGVYNLYSLLDESTKGKYYQDYQMFRKCLYKYRGFGDLKLLEKCSSGLRRKYYHLKRKVFQ